MSIPLVDFEARWEEEAKWQPSSHTPTEHGHQARQEIRWHEWTYVLLSILLLSFASEGLVALCAANTEKISTPTWWKRNVLLFCPQGLMDMSPWKPQGFCTPLQLVFATWLFNQEQCNNMANNAQKCLVWSCAQIFQFLHFIHFCRHLFLTVNNEINGS